MRSGNLLLSISESAALYSCLQYLLSGDLKIPVLIMRLLVFACLRNVVVSRPEMPQLVAYDDALCTATLPQHWGRKGFPYKANNRVQDQKREYYPNDDTLLLLASFHHRYTAGNDFLHSRQNSFERDVINPQDGHILCDPKPAI